MHAGMRWWMLFSLFAVGLRATGAVPPELAAALRSFRADPPRGWSFTQVTMAEGRSTVERCDATKPEFDRWTLVQKDGRAPTADELKDYAEVRSRRSRTGTAPSIVEQLDLGTIEVVGRTPERATFRFRLRPGESRDKTAPFLRATLALHLPTRTIAAIELANDEPFRPTPGVKITELRTTMTYAPPAGDAPSLPEKVTTRVRGRAFWFKSLDADMTVTFADFAPPRKR